MAYDRASGGSGNAGSPGGPVVGRPGGASGYPVLAPAERVRSFAEVCGPVRPQWAVAEARRCLGCEDAPCSARCPAGVDVPRFIRGVRNQSLRAAARALREANVLAATCARVCPAPRQCEGACASGKLERPIAVAALQRFVTDEERRRPAPPEPPPPPEWGPVAIVGAGPAGLAAAAELARLAARVTVFDAAGRPGGLLRAIPAYRLPREVVAWEVAAIAALGVRFVCERKVERPAELLAQGFRAVLLATGLSGIPRLGLDGEDLPGVWDWAEFLRDDWAGSAGARTLVVGGGNSAIDAARVARRRGSADVTVLYRRSEPEMPAFPEEVAAAREEGVAVRFHVLPVALRGDSRLEAVRCVETRPGEPDASGRARPVPVPASEHELPCDTLIVAVGQSLDPALAAACPGLVLGGRVAAGPDTQRTPIEHVFAAGDAVTGGATVVRAVASGRRAARAIHTHLTSLAGAPAPKEPA